jgi:hypothetical protein
MTTLTIELDDQVMTRLRHLAALRNLTVPQMVQRLLDLRLSPPVTPDELGPLTRAATGIAPPMTDEEAADALDEHRTRKYGGQ